MPKLPRNSRLISAAGTPLASLSEINSLPDDEKTAIYGGLLPQRLRLMLGIDPHNLRKAIHGQLLRVIAPPRLPLVRIEAHQRPNQPPVFFMELSDTPFQQIEFGFCIIRDPAAPCFHVDVDTVGRTNWFATKGRNIPEEIRAMRAGLYPNQTCHGLRMFGEVLPLVERLTDSLGMEMMVADLLTYCNAIRYEHYGFSYLNGMQLMLHINREFQPGGIFFNRLDGSSPFRMPGMERTVHGRSWAIYDGIMDEPWNNVKIYKMVGEHAGENTFPDRQRLEEAAYLHQDQA